MVSVNCYKYQNQSDFDSDFQQLSKFKDSTQTSYLAITGPSPSYKISTKAKPRLWQRLCRIFYKPKHLRLRFLVEKTISFLETNASFLKNNENLERLRSFRSNLLSIRSLHKKVNPAHLVKLNKLIADIGKELGDAGKQELENAQKAALEGELRRTEMRNQSNQRILKIKEDTEKVIADSNKIKQDTLAQVHSARGEKRTVQLELFKDANFSFESLRSDAEGRDIIFCCGSEEIAVHPLFFNTLWQKHEKNRKVSPVVRLNLSLETLENLEKLVSWCYGASENLTMSFNRFLEFCLLAQKLFVIELSKIINQAYEKQLKDDPNLAMTTFEKLFDKQYFDFEKIEAETNEQSIENITFKFLLTFSSKDLEVPKECFAKFEPLLRFYNSPHAAKVLDKWKTEGVI